MSKKIFIVFTALLILVFSSCGHKEVKKPEDKVAILMTHISDEFTRTECNVIEQTLADRGFQYRIYDAELDLEKQKAQLNEAYEDGCTAFIVEPMSVDEIIPDLKNAKSRGVKLVLLNQNINLDGIADCFVGTDPVEIGKELMELVCSDLKGEGNIAVLLGPSGQCAQIGRTRGFDITLTNYPDVKVVAREVANWKRSEACEITEKWLKEKLDIDAVVAQNDSMALGAASVIDKKGLDNRIKIYGIDGMIQGREGVITGKLQATVAQDVEKQAEIAADYCCDLLEGKEVPAKTYIDSHIITGENITEP